MIGALMGIINNQIVAVNGGGGIDSYTKAMLHFNGTDASTTFSDVSGKMWTANGNAQIDTAQKKFGTASGLFDGAGDYIDTPGNTDFDVGNGDFTVDFWIRRNSNATTEYIFAQCDAALSQLGLSMEFWWGGNNIPRFAVYDTSNMYVTSSGTTTVTNDSIWHHIACVRNGNILKLYLDGVEQGSRDVTGITVNNSAYKFTIGREGESTTGNFNGWIDEFRFSKGIARWTANFTPPSSEYTT